MRIAGQQRFFSHDSSSAVSSVCLPTSESHPTIARLRRLLKEPARAPDRFIDSIQQETHPVTFLSQGHSEKFQNRPLGCAPFFHHIHLRGLRTTLNTYAHVIPDSQRRTVERVGGVLLSNVLEFEENCPKRENQLIAIAGRKISWWARQDLNLGPTDYELYSPCFL